MTSSMTLAFLIWISTLDIWGSREYVGQWKNPFETTGTPISPYQLSSINPGNASGNITISTKCLPIFKIFHLLVYLLGLLLAICNQWKIPNAEASCPISIGFVSSQYCLPSSMSNTYFNGFVQDCSNSIANALKLLQSCIKPSIWPCLKNAHTIAHFV